MAFAEMLAAKGGKFSVPTTTNAVCCDLERWDRQKCDTVSMAAAKRIEAAQHSSGLLQQTQRRVPLRHAGHGSRAAGAAAEAVILGIPIKIRTRV